MKKYQVVGGLNGTLVLAKTNILWLAKVLRWLYGAEIRTKGVEQN